MKKFVIYLSLTVFLVMGCFTMYKMATVSSPTYDGSKTNVYEISQNPSDFDASESNGIADLLIKETISKTKAMNAVSAVVFDFRGYDTLGESFVLFTAISCAAVVLRKGVKGRSDAHEEKH